MSSLSASQVKYYVQSNLTSLYGTVANIEIDAISNATGDTLEIEGTYHQSFGDDYSFKMVIDSRGNMKSFKREPQE